MNTQTMESDCAWLVDLVQTSVLPLWLQHAITPQGLFLPQRDREWRHVGPDEGTIVSQSRLLYNFASGYRLTGDIAYLKAVEDGAAFLLRHFRDVTHGGWHWACALDGSPTDSTKSTYGHAFAIFGLSHAFDVTDNPALQAAIVDTWQTMDTRLRDEHGGFVWQRSGDFTTGTDERSQNPIMHLFEALMAAGTVGELPDMLARARETGQWVLDSLIDSEGRLPEVFDVHWRPLPADQGGRFDVGHAFEWAFLLSQAAVLDLQQGWLEAAERLLDYGMTQGFDAERGGIVSPVAADGSREKAVKGWWEQCEATRALLHFARSRDRTDLIEPAHKMVTYIRDALIDPDHGGWYSTPSPATGSAGSHKGSVWKVDYHVVGMGVEANV